MFCIIVRLGRMPLPVHRPWPCASVYAGTYACTKHVSVLHRMLNTMRAEAPPGASGPESPVSSPSSSPTRQMDPLAASQEVLLAASSPSPRSAHYANMVTVLCIIYMSMCTVHAPEARVAGVYPAGCTWGSCARA